MIGGDPNGSRVSISFANSEGAESVILFHHSGGMDLFQQAVNYVERRNLSPHAHPGVAMVDFIRELNEDREPVENSIYVCSKVTDYDNSDYGHWAIPLGRSQEFYDGFLVQPGFHD